MIKINKEVLFYCIFTEKRNIFCHVNKQGCYKKKKRTLDDKHNVQHETVGEKGRRVNHQTGRYIYK